MGLLGAEPLARDPAAAWIRAASAEATAAWEGVRGAVDSDLPEMGLAAGFFKGGKRQGRLDAALGDLWC